MSARFLVVLALLAGCGGDKATPGGNTDHTGTSPTTADTDTDTDADTDTDTDTDTDSDTDADTDTDTDTGRSIPKFVCPTLVLDNKVTSWTGSTQLQPDWGGSDCGGLGPEVYLEYTAPFEGRFVFSTEGSTFDTVIYTQEVCGGPVVDCGDNNAPNNADRAALELYEGESGIVVVDSNGQAGNYQLNVEYFPLFEVDCFDGRDEDTDGLTDCLDPDCQAAEEACTPGGVCPEFTRDVVPATVMGNTQLMNDNEDPTCGPGVGSGDARVEFTAPSTGVFRFDTVGSTLDTTVWLTDDCTSASVACDYATNLNGRGRLEHPLDAGQSIVVHIDGTQGTSGDFVLDITEVTATELDCANGTDDDADSLVDCYDNDCKSVPACIEDCSNGVDDDLDGLRDCLDPDCDGEPVCIEDCSNGIDDDLDGDTDCRDLECSNDPLCEEICDNGLDDDFDGFTDCGDPGCDGDAACVEDCTNGIDDDLDARIDCGDSFCYSDPSCTETCDNGIDDDGDGNADCRDSECRTHENCCGDLTLVSPSVINGSSTTNGDTYRPQTCANSGNAGNDVTFMFTAPVTAQYTFNTDGSNYDTVLYVLTTCGGQEIGCDDDGGVGTQSNLTIGLQGGQTYVLVLDTYSGNGGNYDLRVQ